MGFAEHAYKAIEELLKEWKVGKAGDPIARLLDPCCGAFKEYVDSYLPLLKSFIEDVYKINVPQIAQNLARFIPFYRKILLLLVKNEKVPRSVWKEFKGLLNSYACKCQEFLKKERELVTWKELNCMYTLLKWIGKSTLKDSIIAHYKL